MSATATTPLTANLNYISGNHRVECTFARRRPWTQVLNPRTLSRPRSFTECLTRLRVNLSYLRVNFAMMVLFAVFLSLLWDPVSLLVFVAAMGAWVSLFFLPEPPIVVFGHPVDDRIVLALLAALTVIFLLITSSTLNVIISLGLSLAVVLIYSVFRRADDFYIDEEAAAAAGVLRPHPSLLV